jgi:hypothetical protein
MIRGEKRSGAVGFGYAEGGQGAIKQVIRGLTLCSGWSGHCLDNFLGE